jgi:hypothetical protein
MLVHLPSTWTFLWKVSPLIPIANQRILPEKHSKFISFLNPPNLLSSKFVVEESRKSWHVFLGHSPITKFMEANLNPQTENSQSTHEMSNEKSELMKFFEYQVNDAEWAYKDLVKAILEAEPSEA